MINSWLSQSVLIFGLGLLFWCYAYALDVMSFLSHQFVTIVTDYVEHLFLVCVYALSLFSPVLGIVFICEVVTLFHHHLDYFLCFCCYRVCGCKDPHILSCLPATWENIEPYKMDLAFNHPKDQLLSLQQNGHREIPGGQPPSALEWGQFEGVFLEWVGQFHLKTDAGGETTCLLAQYLDYALWQCASCLTVGQVEEDIITSAGAAEPSQASPVPSPVVSSLVVPVVQCLPVTSTEATPLSRRPSQAPSLQPRRSSISSSFQSEGPSAGFLSPHSWPKGHTLFQLHQLHHRSLLLCQCLPLSWPCRVP